MSAKKTKDTPVVPSAEEARDVELELEEMLEGMPELRSPDRLRIRQKNALKAIGLRHASDIEKLQAVREKDAPIDEELALALMDLAAEMDEFAESIAFDKDAYEEWSIKNADNIPVFVALLNKYMTSLGE